MPHTNTISETRKENKCRIVLVHKSDGGSQGVTFTIKFSVNACRMTQCCAKNKVTLSARSTGSMKYTVEGKCYVNLRRLLKDT